MAGIVVQADAAAEGIGIRSFLMKPLEECEGLGGVLEMSERFGFQPEVKITTGFGGEFLQKTGKREEVFPDFLLVHLESLVGAGKRGDGGSGAGCGNGGEDPEQIPRVGEARRIAPVRLEDPFLHPGTVEAAVGKAVDGEDIGIGFCKPVAKPGEMIAGEKLPRRDGGKAEPDGKRGIRGKRAVRAEPVADGENVFFQHAQGIRPGLGGMDVRAVGEMGGIEFQGGGIVRDAGGRSNMENAPGEIPAELRRNPAILQNFADLWIPEGLLETGMMEKRGKAAFRGEILEIRFVDDDGAGVGFSGFGIDDGFRVGAGLVGDELGQCDVVGIGQGIEMFQNEFRNDGCDGLLEPDGEIRHRGWRCAVGCLADFRDGADVMKQGGPGEPKNARGCDAEKKSGKDRKRRAGSAGAPERPEEEPDDETGCKKRHDKGENGQAGDKPCSGLPGPADGEGGRSLPDEKPHPQAARQNEGC